MAGSSRGGPPARAKAKPAQWPLVVMGMLAAGGIVGGVVRYIDTRPVKGVATWRGAPKQGGPVVVPTGDPLDRWRVTYRVDTGRPLGASSSTQLVAVQRPFASLQQTTSKGGTPGDLGSVVSGVGRLALKTPGQDTTVLGRPADLAAADLRLDLGLDRLLADGRLLRRERRVIAGRPCQVYRSSGPLEGSTALAKPDGDDHTDTCVDARGLVLGEVAFHGAVVLRQQLATAVDESPTITDADLAVSDPTVPANRGGAGFVLITDGSGPVGHTFVLDAPPAGFTKLGRYADVDAQTQNGQGVPLGDRRAGFSDVFTSGRDLLVLDQGSTKGGGPPFAVDPYATPIDLGALGSGQAITGTRVQAVRIALGTGGAYVRVAGTLPVDRLAEVARSLRTVEVPIPG